MNFILRSVLKTIGKFLHQSLSLCSIIILIDLGGAQAAENHHPLEYITINDGLSDNYITSIHQDRFGYMWFGTMDGLNRYDGNSFIIFRNIPNDSSTLSENYIRSFDENESGDLYITTNTGGLNYYNRKEESFKQIKLSDKSGAPFTQLSFIKCMPDDRVWIGTQNGYVLRYDTRHGTVEWYGQIPKDFDNHLSNQISDIYPDSTGNIWIASGLGGLDYLTFPNGEIQHILLADTLQERFRRNGCGQITIAPDGRLWVSRVSGLDWYDPRNGKSEHYAFEDCKGEMLKAYNLLFDFDGKILLNSYYDLIRFDPKYRTHEVVGSILPQYFTPPMMMDASGIIWTGTNGYGVIKIDPNRGRFNTTPGNYLQEVFGNELSLLAQSEGVDLTLRDANIISVIRDRKRNTWVCTGYWGLYKIEHGTRNMVKYHMGELDIRQRYQMIYEVFEDRDGEIWVSTIGGISKLNQESGQFQYYRLYPGTNTAGYALNKTGYLDISCFCQDAAHVFWLGTPDLGLIRFSPADDSLTYIPITPRNRGNSKSFPILTVAEDPLNPDRILWLGTEGGGLVRFDKETGQSLFITTREGLPSSIVNCILTSPDQNLWMSTNMGLSRYRPGTGRFLNYDVRDGLQSNGFNRREGYKSESGEFFFGGTYGYNHFYPQNIRENPAEVPIVLTGIDLLNEPVIYHGADSVLNAPLPLMTELTLDHEQSMMVTFNYTALTYSNPHRIRYAYKLENFDGRWINNGNRRSAVYTNLGPGNYRFRVRQVEDINRPDAKELSLAMVVLPPYWATWWFRTLVSLLAFSVIGMIIQNVRRKNALEREREKRFSRQLIQSQEAERKRIAEDLHDSIGQSLLIIKNKLIVGMRHFTSPPESVRYLEEASTITSQTLQDIRQVTRELRPVDLDHLGLTKTIRNMVDKVAEASSFTVRSRIDNIDGKIPTGEEINLYRIIQEAFNNIIKHSGATAVSIDLVTEDDYLDLRIEDNGTGFDVRYNLDSGQAGFGVHGMQERAKMLSAILNIEPVESGGTRIILIIPIIESEHGSR